MSPTFSEQLIKNLTSISTGTDIVSDHEYYTIILIVNYNSDTIVYLASFRDFSAETFKVCLKPRHRAGVWISFEGYKAKDYVRYRYRELTLEEEKQAMINL